MNSQMAARIKFYSSKHLYQQELVLAKQFLAMRQAKDLVVALGEWFSGEDLGCYEDDILLISEDFELARHCCAKWTHLPLQNHSVDYLLVSHVLFTQSVQTQKMILQEAYRVLCEDGHLLIMDYSAHSLWRFNKEATFFLPPKKNCQSTSILKAQIKQLGFECQQSHCLDFAPFAESEPTADHFAPIEAIGQKLWPQFCAAFVLEFKKKTIFVRPLLDQQDSINMADLPVLQRQAGAVQCDQFFQNGNEA
jgi:SAM-dependent methyltransferase